MKRARRVDVDFLNSIGLRLLGRWGLPTSAAARANRVGSIASRILREWLLVPVRTGAAAGLMWSFCVGMAATEDTVPVRIGLLLPPEEPAAVSLRQGAELAVRGANRACPGSFEMLVRGRPGQWGDDGAEAGRMVLDDSVVALIAPPGGVPTHLALQVAGRTATPVVSLCGDDSITGAGVPWAVRIVPGTVDEAQTVMAAFKAERRPRVAAFVPAGRAGREVARDLSRAATMTGCQLDPIISVESPLRDVSAVADRLAFAWPDGLLFWLDGESAVSLARRFRAAGFPGTMAGPSCLVSGAVAGVAGEALGDFVVPRPRLDSASAEAEAAFAEAYIAQYGDPPDAIAAMAYDAASLLIRLAREAQGHVLHDQFPITGTLAGVTGPIRFDRQGNRCFNLELCRFREGRWVPVLDTGDPVR